MSVRGVAIQVSDCKQALEGEARRVEFFQLGSHSTLAEPVVAWIDAIE